MMKYFLSLLCCISIVTVSFSQELNLIAFGSCSKQEIDDQLWPDVSAKNPDLWIWLGDNVYADTEDMKKMKKDYDTQKSRATYAALISNTPVIGTWDDHDYGVNDGGKEFAKKDESKALLLDFLEVPKSNEVWSHDGVYQSYTYGAGNQKVKIILLDTRYFRDPIEKEKVNGKRRYKPNMDGGILGEDQWKWLEKELTNSDARVHVIASSIQIIPEEHAYEKWANFPAERKRFFDLLAEKKPSNPVLLSGDRHISEFMSINIEGYDSPVYEFTSSGLTHTWSSVGEEPNKYRDGELLAALSFGTIQFDWENNTMMLEMNGKNNEVFKKKSLAMD